MSDITRVSIRRCGQFVQLPQKRPGYTFMDETEDPGLLYDSVNDMMPATLLWLLPHEALRRSLFVVAL